MNALPDNLDTKDLLNAQTGRIRWSEMQRLFAQGLLLHVAADLDLVEVAAQVVKDDQAQVQQWLSAGQLRRVETEQAKTWHAQDTEFWAVVAAPWVLLQEA